VEPRGDDAPPAEEFDRDARIGRDGAHDFAVRTPHRLEEQFDRGIAVRGDQGRRGPRGPRRPLARARPREDLLAVEAPLRPHPATREAAAEETVDLLRMDAQQARHLERRQEAPRGSGLVRPAGGATGGLHGEARTDTLPPSE
jgi:hypothetical protein